jgi:branched-chain amino acid transport system permease protein
VSDHQAARAGELELAAALTHPGPGETRATGNGLADGHPPEQSAGLPASPAGKSARAIPYALIGKVAAGAVLLAAPLYVEAFWLQLGLFAFATMVAAFGLTLLLGQAGMLSLGHAFFIALGAYGYTYFAADASAAGGGAGVGSGLLGLGLPPLLAAVLAVALAGVAGLMFSPIAARLRGIYLGIASLGLVFLGQHVLVNAEAVTGGVNGRNVPAFTVPGFSFEAVPGQTLYVLGVPFHREERLWYLGLAVVVAAFGCYRALARGRAGRAWRAMRDHEVAAAAMGVHVARYKAGAFLVSSMYAGLGGVLLALAFRRMVPETFGVALSIEYLAIVVIGGIGSAGGAIFGAVFVSSLPAVLERYADQLPGVAAGGAEGIAPGIAARFAYGAAIILIVLFEPGGAAAFRRRLRRSRPRSHTRGKAAASATTMPQQLDSHH